MNEYIKDVCYSAAERLKKLEINEITNQYNVAIVGHDHELGDILKKTVNNLMDKSLENEVIHIDTIQELDDYKFKNGRPVCVFFIVNLRSDKFKGPDAKAYMDETLDSLELFLINNKKHRHNLFQLVTCIPEIREDLPKGINAMAEREYEVIYRNYPESSPEKFVIKMEDKLRSHREQTDRVQVVRVDRMFGPGIKSDEGLCINQIFRDIKEGKPLVIYDADRYEYFSASYVEDAMVGIIIAIMSGRKGNIYNISSWELNRFEVISLAFELFKNYNISLETKHDGLEYHVSYRMINPYKLQLTHKRKIKAFLFSEKELSLDKTGHWFLKEPDYVQKNDTNVYFGRMDRIREIELGILDEVDRICKENNIEYFIAAGTQLGAVRHKGFIPWDDDVDIGMLPEEYEKFLKVCPESLSVEYGYQNVYTENTSHYIHDKIRLKNSFFSTKYSDKYQMLNGVYIDVFVYYKTANTKFFQKKHIAEVALWRKLIGVRWAIYKKNSRRYNLAFDISHAVPARWVDNVYRHVLMKYNWRNTKYRIDGGFNLTKVGAFPDEWFHGTIEAEFCGKKYPILKHYNDYLTHWYSSHYMELLPISARASVHDVVRIDLGQNLFPETAEDKRFRDVDLRGELYEKYKEK